jgi:hypothetical protein
MVMDPTGPGTENDYAGEGQQQFIQNGKWSESVMSLQSALAVSG